jgi:hypothetical protein
MCVLAVTVRGNPELETRRDKLVVRTILYSSCHKSYLTSEFLPLGGASVTSEPRALIAVTPSWISVLYQGAMP